MLYMHFITSSKMKYSEIRKPYSLIIGGGVKKNVNYIQQDLFVDVFVSIVDQTGISKLKLILKNILDNKYVPCFN